MPSVSRSVRRTPRGGKGSLLSPLRSASPLRRPAPSSFSRLDDTDEPSPAALTPSAVQPSATATAPAPAPAPTSTSALALTMTTPYSGRPDPRRTLTPVDLDETPPPETPSNASGFTPTGTTFDSFGFPTDEKAASASASASGAGDTAGAAAVVGNGTSNDTNIDPFVSPSAASFANTSNNGNNNGNNSNASTPRVQQNTTNDPFLDLTVDDDGFVTSGFGHAHAANAASATMANNKSSAAASSTAPAAKSPAPPNTAAGRPPAYRSPLPPKPNDANATPNANASLLSSAKKKKSLQSHFNNAASAHNNGTPNSQSIHRGMPSSSNNSVAGNSVASAGSKHIGQLAVDSNCIAGEFREIVVTLSEASTFDDEDENGNGQNGTRRDNNNNVSRESYGSREMKQVVQNGTTAGGVNGAGTTAEDIAFGLDPRDISQLEDDDDDDEDEYGADHHHPGQYRNGEHMFPDEAAAAAAAANARDGRGHGNNNNNGDNDNDDYGPTDRTPPRHPHGPREGAEHMVVLSESQKKLREKLLRGSGGSGKGVRPSGTTSTGTRLDDHFASPTASGIPRPHDRSVMGSSQSVGGVPRSISTNNLSNVGSGEDGDAANTSPSSMISGVTNFTEGGFPANPSLPSHVYRADGEELPQSAAQYRGTWMLPNGQKQGVGGQGFMPGSGVGPDYTMSYLDKPSGIDATPASVIADRRMAAAMRAAGNAPMPPPSATSSGNSVHSAPGAGRSRGSSSSHPAQPDDEVMRSVANRVKTSMRLGSASPPPPSSHPGLPRPRSVSPKPGRSSGTAAPSVQLRHREYADGSPRGAASSAGGAANGSSIVFGAPDTFEAADALPSIRDRAKALNDWMGGKGVKIEKEVRPTAGYTNDEMYQNAYLRRTSPQVVGSRKTIGDARASLTPPKTRPAPNSGTFAHGSSSSAKKSSSNGAGGSATKSRNAPAFLAKFQGNGSELPSSPEGDVSNSADAGGSAAKSKNAPAFLSKFQGSAFPEEADRELPPISVGEAAASASDQGKSPSTQASPASLKENAMPPTSTSAKKAVPRMEPKSMFQQQSNTKSISTDNNDDDMIFLRSWGKSRGKQPAVETPTSPSDDSFPGSPKFDDDGFGDVVSMNGKVQASGDAWGVENAHDDDAWANSDADFGEPFYS